MDFSFQLHRHHPLVIDSGKPECTGFQQLGSAPKLSSILHLSLHSPDSCPSQHNSNSHYQAVTNLHLIQNSSPPLRLLCSFTFVHNSLCPDRLPFQLFMTLNSVFQVFIKQLSQLILAEPLNTKLQIPKNACAELPQRLGKDRHFGRVREVQQCLTTDKPVQPAESSFGKFYCSKNLQSSTYYFEYPHYHPVF